MKKLGPKTHVAGVVGRSRFDFLAIKILLTANNKFLLHSIAQNFLI